MDNLTDLLEEPKVFVRDSIHLLNRCTKPDRRGVFFVYGLVLPSTACLRAISHHPANLVKNFWK